jgi:hypothetical protein
MTACGFCVVAALSNHTSGRPLTRSRRIGKSRRTALTSNVGVRILVVLADLDVIEHGQRVGRVDGQRAVQRDQVRGDRVAVDAHEAHRQPRALLARQARLEQADDALALLADAQQQDLGLAVGHRHLVRRDQRNAAPGEELRAEQAHRRRRHAAARAFAAERGDRQRVRQEERGLLPDLGQQLVEVVRRRRAVSG